MNTNAVNQTAENGAVSSYEETKKRSSVSGKTIGTPKLSDKAKQYYEQLKSKYHDMDFILVSSDMKEQAKASAGQYANANRMVVLIDEEKIERMAEDETYRKQYEGIIGNSRGQLARMKTSFGGVSSAVKTFGIQVNDGGNASFFAVVDKSLALQKKRIAAKSQENAKEKKAAVREAAEKALEKAKDKKTDKTDNSKDRIEDTGDYVTVTADSIEELNRQIEDALYAGMSDGALSSQEQQLGTSIDFRG